MDAIVQWFAATLEPYVSKEAAVFIISLFPILELRGGLLAARLLDVEYARALVLCVIGNILPIPFILFFIRKIFFWMKKVPLFRGLVEGLENHALGKSDKIRQYEFLGLILFVGIPLPGTGGWTGALIASLLQVDIKKSSLAILIGIALAAVIMSIVSYGIMGSFLG